MALADLPELDLGMRRKAFRKVLDEFGERLVDGDAEIGAVGLGVERVERPQPQDMLGVDRIGIAPPRFDVGNRQPAWAGRERWAWRRTLNALTGLRPVGIRGRGGDFRVGAEPSVEPGR